MNMYTDNQKTKEKWPLFYFSVVTSFRSLLREIFPGIKAGKKKNYFVVAEEVNVVKQESKFYATI